MSRVVRAVQYLTLVACALTVVMLFVYDPAPTEIVVPDDPEASLGAVVFAARCAGCHGAEGEGGYGPALAGGVVVSSYPEVADQIAVVEAGSGSMPGFADQLSPEEIEAVVAYTRSMP